VIAVATAAHEHAVGALDGVSFARVEVAIRSIEATHDAIPGAWTVDVAVSVARDIAVARVRAPNDAVLAHIDEAITRARAGGKAALAATEVALA